MHYLPRDLKPLHLWLDPLRNRRQRPVNGPPVSPPSRPFPKRVKGRSGKRRERGVVSWFCKSIESMDDGMVGVSTIVHVFCSINDNPCDWNLHDCETGSPRVRNFLPRASRSVVACLPLFPVWERVFSLPASLAATPLDPRIDFLLLGLPRFA